MPEQQLLHDYNLEEWLRCPYRYHHAENTLGIRPLSWRQLVQYSVGHVMNDYYSLMPDARRQGVVRTLVDRRWTNKVCTFDSAEHYEGVKLNVTQQLEQLLEQDSLHESEPMIRYEQWEAELADLNVRLSMIFQLVFAVGNSEDNHYAVRRVVVNDDEPLISAYMHMTAVFCDRAFGYLPEQIEVISLLDESRSIVKPDEAFLRQSHDYMRLMIASLAEFNPIKNCGYSLECRQCPFSKRCHQ